MDLVANQGPEELIAFFDLETAPTGQQGWVIVEFGAILVCPRRLVQVGEPYSTLIRPSRKALVDNFSDRPNGITRQAIAKAPRFAEVSDEIYQILHGRVWAGHNIKEFDCPLIKEAYAKSKREAPRYKFLIDTLPLLRQWFGKRAGDLTLATLGNYFGYGEQEHRCLDDVSRKAKSFTPKTLHSDMTEFLVGDIDDGIVHWETKIWRDGHPTMERVEHSELDDDELEMLFAPDTYVDAFFCLDTFDFKKMAGIRLVAKKLFIHPSYS